MPQMHAWREMRMCGLLKLESGEESRVEIELNNLLS